MTVKTGTAWAGTFVTQNSTGALATPSTGPAGVLYVDGTANAAEVTITGTNPYKFSVTLPALTAGQRVDMYITATIATIATAGVVASEQADTALTSEVKTETAAILADTGTDGVLVSSGTGAKQISLDSGKVLLQATQTGVTIPTVTAVTNGVSIASAQTVATVTDVTNAVKISAGTGAGQLDFTSGVVKANLAQILGTALTETAGQIAASFKKFFNVAAPTGTVNSLPDAVAGANGGLPTTDGTKVAQTVDLTAGQSIAVNGGTVATVTNLTNLPTMPNDWITAAGLKADAVTKIQANLALESTLTAMKGAGWTTETLKSLSTLIDLVKAKTDNIPLVPAPANEYDARMTTIQADLDNPSQYKADVSGLALESTLTAIKGAGWTTETLKSIKEAISLTPEGITIQDLKDIVIEGDFTFYDLLKVIPAALAGKLNGGGTGTLHFRNLMDTLDRITAEVDLETGDRTSITLDLT